jgi:mRNA-degrading endonuclease toxin of MazEF toxin-antitoxin module
MNKQSPPQKPSFVKRFRAWNRLKVKINFNDNVPNGYKERDIWWVAIGHNVGVEEDGKGNMFNRPVIIIKGFSKYQFWGIPMSTTEKSGKYYHKVVVNGKTSTALISQLRTFDTRRLISKYGMASKKDLDTIKRKVMELIK